MRRVEQIMGMPITVDIPDCSNAKVFDFAFERLREIDSRFSPYKKKSELYKYQRGELKEKDLSLEFKKIQKACKKAEKDTDGYFSAYFAGKYDPTGYVKGWAISETGKVIGKSGHKTYCISAGGDILAKSDGSKEWKIGIEDPRAKILNKSSKLLDLLSISNGAVATSGNYERGNHIINPKTNRPAIKFLSATVIGPDIIKADILATATFAAEARNVVKIPKNYQVIVTEN